MLVVVFSDLNKVNTSVYSTWTRAGPVLAPLLFDVLLAAVLVLAELLNADAEAMSTMLHIQRNKENGGSASRHGPVKLTGIRSRRATRDAGR